MSSEATNNNVQKMASAIDDLLYMGAIKFRDIGTEQPSETAILSTQLSIIVSKLMTDMNINEHNKDDVLKLMYFSLLIYLNEYLKLPKPLTIAFGNDLEKHREGMQCSELISSYVNILQNIFSSQRNQSN